MKFSKSKTQVYKRSANVVKRTAPKGMKFCIWVHNAERELGRKKVSKMVQGFNESGFVCIQVKSVYEVQYKDSEFASRPFQTFILKRNAMKNAKEFVNDV